MAAWAGHDARDRETCKRMYLDRQPVNVELPVCSDSARPLRYVLSAGRTGTVFLADLLNRHVPGVAAAHEPSATRYQMMLGNLRNDWGLGGSLLEPIFRRSRLARERAAGGLLYVEINPLLCAIADLLPQEGRPLRVVHMVRDPACWARSITAFRASPRYRAVIDHVPFSRPFPSPRPAGWRALSDYEQALWRWRWCNERILGLRERCDAYAIVRFEDLFGGSMQDEALAAIFATLGLPAPTTIDGAEMSRQRNAGPRRAIDLDTDRAAEICGGLAGQFGYAY